MDPITKDILAAELRSGERPAAKLLFGSYGGMLFTFILEFIPDRAKAEALLLDIFLRITPRLEEACYDKLDVYCWLQREARTIILEYQNGQNTGPVPQPASYTGYQALLRYASEEHREVFREVFFKGKKTCELAGQWKRDPADILRLLRESLKILRAHLQ